MLKLWCLVVVGFLPSLEHHPSLINCNVCKEFSDVLVINTCGIIIVVGILHHFVHSRNFPQRQ